MQNITNLKDDLINLKDRIIKNLQYENKCLKTKVTVLENKITHLEIQNNVDQYIRRNNVEISGIPQSVSDNQQEEKVVDILKAINVNITSNEIEACHRLMKKKKNVIFRVINRKHCLRNKKKLKSIDKNVIGIPNTNLFISENSTPVNSKFTFNCLKLKTEGEIEKCYTMNGIVHIAKNNTLMKIYHLKDLQEPFPEYVFDNSDHAE